VGPVNAENARLQRQIEELSAKLESTQMRLVNDSNTSRKAVLFEGNEEAQATSLSRTASPEQSRGRSLERSNRWSSQSPAADTRGGERQRSRSSGPSTQESGGNRQSGWQPREQQRDTSRPRYNNNQESSREHQSGQTSEGKPVNLTMVYENHMVNQGPSTEEVRREEGCSLHFLEEVGGLLGEGITGLVGKQQILGKIRGEIQGNILGKILGKMLVGVIIVTTQ